MNVYDFDNTIYDGETVVDFYFFLLRKKPSLIKYIPIIFYMLIRYKLGMISVAELEEKANRYSKEVLLALDDVKTQVKEFWDCHEHKIKKFYLEQKKDDDIIISASCGFILDEILKRLNISRYLCSEININTGEILQVCYNSKKLEILKSHYPDAKIDCFYTDSMSDLPLIKISKRAFLVKGDKITEITKKES